MNPVPFAMVGAGGRMGRTIVDLAREWGGGQLRLVGALERADSPYLGEDAGVLAGGLPLGVRINGDPAVALEQARVIIDFTTPATTLRVAEFCAGRGIGVVVGTTGLAKEDREALAACARKIPVLVAPNMSLGVNLLFHLTAVAARSLQSGFDVEVTETHHHFKKDAPSGTALRLKDVLLAALERVEADVVYGREGIGEARPPREIGVHALRGGDVVGDHTVFFFGEGERIELTHRATSRTTFASGALAAARFVAGAAPGLYGMNDVLQIT